MSNRDTECSDARPLKPTLWLRLIASVQLLGSVVGCVLGTYLLISGNVPGPSAMFLVVAGSVVGYAGIRLWQAQRRGIQLSIVVQLLQAFGFTASSLSYDFHFGGSIQLLILENGWRLLPKVGSSAYVGAPVDHAIQVLAVNLTALLSTAYLIVMWRRNQTQEPRQ